MASEPDGHRLCARGLAFSIGEIRIVDRFDMTVRAGEVMGLIGPNGAGKTTAIDLLSGFRLPDRGSVLIDGRDVTRLAPDRRVRCGLARTFQESPAVPGLSVLEHVQLAVDAAGRGPKRDALSADELLAGVGLREVRDAAGTSLPIGQRRMLDLARALGTSAEVLLLDEPFAGLEEREEEQLTAAVDRLRAQGAAVVVVEHRLKLLSNIADSVVVLVQGVPVARGTLEQVLEDPEVRRAYLGTGDARESEP